MWVTLLLLALVAQATTVIGGLAVIAAQALNGWLSAKLYDGLKTIIPQYDKLPSLVHQIAAPVFGFAFGWLTAATGAELLTDIHAVNAGWIGGILNALAMAGVKRWEKSKEPVDATAVMEATRASQPGVYKGHTRQRTRRPADGLTGNGPNSDNL